MPRPPKWRRVEFVPEITHFKPAGVPLRRLEEIVLTVEELEAIRLKDQEGLDQEACAERMQVSRPTFHRIITSARGKVARALIEGKAIRIAGGRYRLARRRFRCRACRHGWEEPFGAGAARDLTCPECASPEVYREDWDDHRHASTEEE